MANETAQDVDLIVQRILEDTDVDAPSPTGFLGAQTESLSGEELNELLALLRAKNPPVLGTGTVS